MRLFIAPVLIGAAEARAAARGQRCRADRRRRFGRWRPSCEPIGEDMLVRAQAAGVVRRDVHRDRQRARERSRRRGRRTTGRACGSRADLASELEPGDSVAVNGACLTRDLASTGRFEADVDEPDPRADHARRARARRPGQPRAAAAGRRPARRPHRPGPRRRRPATVAAITEDGFATPAAGRAPGRAAPATSSSAARSRSTGVSLTVAALGDDCFEVSLIPETLERTTLGGARARRPGQRRVRRPGPLRPARSCTIGMSPLSEAEEREQPMTKTRTSQIEDQRTTAGPIPFSTIEEAIEDIRRGRMVVVCDDEDRENEGDLTMAAQFATPEAVNFMATHGRGLICLALTAERCDELGLNLMAAKNEAPLPDRVHGLDRGRARGSRPASPPPTAPAPIQVAIDPHSQPRGPGPAGPRLPAQGQGRRRPGAHRPHRGGHRPGPPRRPDPGRGDLRDHERGRDDGPRPRPGRLLRQSTT